MGGPFRTLKLTAQEQQQCRDCTFQLLDRTLRSYDERDGRTENGRSNAPPRHHSNLDNTRWKLLKTKTRASLYTERNSCTLQDQNLFGGEWQNPLIILMVGTIQGNLDEIMLGVETNDSNSYRTRSEIFMKLGVTCEILAELMGPTERDPFRFLSVAWMMIKFNWPLKAILRPLDFVVVKASGTMTRSNGDRIGYEVVQPIRLSQCPPLPGSTVRGKMMYAVIMKQQELRVVDVFVHTYAESGGVILDSLTATSTWRALIGFWDVKKLADMKKIQWCLDNCSSEGHKEQRRVSSLALSNCKQCHNRRSGMQRSSGGVQREKDSCVLCTTLTCSKCRVEQTLKVVNDHNGKLMDQLVAVCQPCMMFVQELRPADIAILNYKWRRQQKRASR